MLFIDHWLWPYATMIGGGVFVDMGGREVANLRGLKGKGVRVGSRREFLTAAAAYVCLIATGLLSIGIGLSEAI